MLIKKTKKGTNCKEPWCHFICNSIFDYFQVSSKYIFCFVCVCNRERVREKGTEKKKEHVVTWTYNILNYVTTASFTLRENQGIFYLYSDEEENMYQEMRPTSLHYLSKMKI